MKLLCAYSLSFRDIASYSDIKVVKPFSNLPTASSLIRVCTTNLTLIKFSPICCAMSLNRDGSIPNPKDFGIHRIPEFFGVTQSHGIKVGTKVR
jgi:hypothetical protein